MCTVDFTCKYSTTCMPMPMPKTNWKLKVGANFHNKFCGNRKLFAEMGYNCNCVQSPTMNSRRNRDSAFPFVPSQNIYTLNIEAKLAFNSSTLSSVQNPGIKRPRLIEGKNEEVLPHFSSLLKVKQHLSAILSVFGKRQF